MKKRLFTLAILSLIVFTSGNLFAQLVSTNPSVPFDNQSVIVTFNAAEGNAGLAGYTGDVYAHTGVITDQSTTPSDWKHVLTGWGQNSPETKLTSLGNNMYELSIGPSIRDYYNVPSNETILQMAFVFRSEATVGGDWLVGKTTTGGDIFVDVYQQGLNVAIIQPAGNGLIVELTDDIEIEVAGSLADSIALYLDNSQLSLVAGNQLDYTYTANTYGKHIVKAIAWDNIDQVVDSFYFYVRPEPTIQDMPAGMQHGINYINGTTVLLSLYAPEKQFAFAIGSFSNWEVDDSNYMNRSTDGKTYWVQLENLVPGQEYLYQYTDGEGKVADPYAEKISDPWNDHYIPNTTYPNLIDYPTGMTDYIASVFQTNQPEYTWTNNTWNRPDKEDLVVYELLIRDFTSESNVQKLIDTLNYLEFLGINAIELMPVNEFEGNLSWGYNPDFYFAFDKYYGPKNEYKRFIDTCHSRGIAVIMDMALNHSFGLCPLVQMYWDAANNQPAANNPWFNQQATHDYNVGFDFNHESQDTKNFFKRVVKFWIEEYKIDGYRFDLSKGYTQNYTVGNVGAWGNYDASRVNIWKSYADYIWGIDNESYVILEHFADNNEEKELANYGMMFWGNLNHNYNEATMGWTGNDISWGSYTNRGWNNPHLITYMESHDEERLMYKNLEYGNSSGSYNVKDLSTALARCELAANFFFPIPGPKMIWQFGELGYDVTIDYNGRTGPKPLKWFYYDDLDRNKLFNVYRALIELKNTEPAFSTNNFSLAVGNYFKRINLYHASMNVVVLGNFDVVGGNMDPNFPVTGKWYEFYSGDSITVSDLHANIYLDAGEYKLYTTKKFEIPEMVTAEVASILGNPNQSLVYPNPSSNNFTIVFNGSVKEKTSIEIYNSFGQMLNKFDVETGKNSVIWNADDFYGTRVPSGMYFCNIHRGEHLETIKLIRQ
jgi:glycosidase